MMEQMISELECSMVVSNVRKQLVAGIELLDTRRDTLPRLIFEVFVEEAQQLIADLTKYADAAAKGPEELHHVIEFERLSREAAIQRSRESHKNGEPARQAHRVACDLEKKAAKSKKRYEQAEAAAKAAREHANAVKAGCKSDSDRVVTLRRPS